MSHRVASHHLTLHYILHLADLADLFYYCSGEWEVGIGGLRIGDWGWDVKSEDWGVRCEEWGVKSGEWRVGCGEWVVGSEE